MVKPVSKSPGPVARPAGPSAGAVVPVRWLLLGVGAVWGLLGAAYGVRRVGELRARWPTVLLPPAEAARVTSGEPPYYDFLAGLAAAAPGPRPVAILAFDPGGQYTFYFYRAVYTLLPRHAYLLPVASPLPTGPRAKIKIDANTEGLLASRGITDVGVWNAGPAPRTAFYGITRRAGGQLDLAELPAAPPAPPPPARGWAWPVGAAVLLALGFAFLRVTGLSALAGAWPDRAALAFVAGAGLTAWLMEVMGIGGVAWSLPSVLAAWAVLLAGSFAVRRFAGIRSAAAGPANPPDVGAAPFRGADRAGVVLLAAGAGSVALTLLMPFSAWGNWDAWAIWGTRTKACFGAAGIPWAFLGDRQYEYSHHEYPLAIPALQSFLALFVGTVNDQCLRATSLAYYLALAALLVRVMRLLGAGEGCWLAAGAFVVLPKILEQAGSGSADLIVACAMAATAVALLAAHRGLASSWAIGLFGGLAGMLKDEGLVCAGGCALVAMCWRGSPGARLARAAAVAACLVVLVGPWKTLAKVKGYQTTFAYTADPGLMLENLPERGPTVLSAVALETLGPGLTMERIAGRAAPATAAEWWNHAMTAWLAFWYVVIAGLLIGIRRLLRPGPLSLLGVFAVQAAATCAVYLVSLLNLTWHLVTSLDRLVLQLSPAALALAAAVSLPVVFDPPPPGRT